jgi:polar amino acid transport system substrate-binding protein
VATPKYYQSATDYYLAVESGRVDLYLGPNPTVTYHVATAGKTEIRRHSPAGPAQGGPEVTESDKSRG